MGEDSRDCCPGQGREYFVSPAGNDNWSGRMASANQGGSDGPFRSLARAVKELRPGDTCALRQGVYREILRPVRSGSAEQPICFRSYPGERAIISGAEPVTGWKHDRGSTFGLLVA